MTERSTKATSGGETLLGIYLNDHLAVMTLAVELARRAARGQQGTASGDVLKGVAGELADDRSALLAFMSGLDVPVRQYKVIAARAAERIGRLKPNGHVVRRSPLSNVVEVEALLAEVDANGACWRTLRDVAAAEPRLDAAKLDRLLERTQRQVEVLERCRAVAAGEAFGGVHAAEPRGGTPAGEDTAEDSEEDAAEPSPPEAAPSEATPSEATPSEEAESSSDGAGQPVAAPRKRPDKADAEAADDEPAPAPPKRAQPKRQPKSAKVIAEESGALGEVPDTLPEAPSHEELPLPDYDHLPIGSLRSRVRTLDRIAVEQLLAYERAHADRLPVVIVLQRRLAELTEGAQPTPGSPDGDQPEKAAAPAGASAVSPATAGPPMNAPAHGDPTNPAQPRT